MPFSVYFLNDNLNMVNNFLNLKKTIKEINIILKKKTNINQFFRSKADLNEFRHYLLGLLNKKKKRENFK